MRFLLLIYSPESIMANMNESEQGAYMDQWMGYTADLQTHGTMLGGDALQPVATAKTVRGGIASDGPFAETKEALGGFYMVDAATQDEAVAWAKKMPNIGRGGAVEVRPIMELG